MTYVARIGPEYLDPPRHYLMRYYNGLDYALQRKIREYPGFPEDVPTIGALIIIIKRFD